jgi:hypothetical protein
MRWICLMAALLLPIATARAQTATDAQGRTINSGSDASSSPPSLSGLNLLGTLFANAARVGYLVQVQDTATDCAPASGVGINGIVVAFDDGNGNNLLIGTLGFALTQGGQGGSFDMAGMPHAGRIRVYGKSGCQVALHQW